MSEKPGLSQILRRIQWRMAVVALVVVGIILTLVSLIYLRGTLSHSLELVSRSVAYSAEAIFSIFLTVTHFTSVTYL